MNTLTILIPTYNRCNDLNYNLNLIRSIVVKGSWLSRIQILVSNNCSTDNTQKCIDEFLSKSGLNFVSYTQLSNIGLEKNALFCLEKATSDFVMFLGDDDYLSYEYVRDCIEDIDNCSDLKCIIPSWQGITPTKEMIAGKQRDVGEKKRYFEKGFNNCYINAQRGHQLSGLVFHREGLLKSYYDRKVSNIYPFIYFVGYSCLNGVTIHNPEHPILITQPGQSQKDWAYGEDGLISEIFDNYKKLNLNFIQRSLLEVRQIAVSPWRYGYYREIGGNRGMFAAMKKIVFGKNTSPIGGLLISFWFIFVTIRYGVRKIIGTR